MKPDPSMRIRCASVPEAAGASGSAMARSDAKSVSVIVPGPRVQAVDTRAIGAEGLLIDDVQPHAGMPERTHAAIAGDDPAVGHDDLRLAHVGRRRVGLESHLNPLVGGGTPMIALRAVVSTCLVWLRRLLLALPVAGCAGL